MSDLSVVSVYSGAGGLDLGFQKAGFDVKWANDFDELCAKTYKANIGDHIVCSDVLHTKAPKDLKPRVVIGGPPCQGFSVHGKMDKKDPRSKHVHHFFDVVEQLDPDAFVMENVKSLAVGQRWASIRQSLIKRAKKLGYNVELFLLNASHYGVPQARERMFLVGIKGVDPISPTPTTAQSPPTVRDALKKLPTYNTPGNHSLVTAKVIPAKTPVMRPTAYKGSLLFNGSGRPLDLDAPAKTLPASMGGNATPIIDQEELANGAAPWVVTYHARLLKGGKPLTKAPKRMRRLTVEEAAALQTFPRNFTFSGSKVAQLNQIGNAVPPKLAQAVAAQLRAQLEAVEVK